MIIHVDASARSGGSGSEALPYRRIQDAAAAAQPGDEILVEPGIYREYVNPIHAGTPDHRIVYRSRVPHAAVITGAERISGWEKIDENVWRVRIPNGFFGDYNPYTTLVSGDWFNAYYTAHTGEVYLNSHALYEVTEKEKVLHPEVDHNAWDEDATIYTWYTEQDPEKNETILYANFQGADPNHDNVEINVRRNCFMPSEEGIGYITLSGFTVNKAATQWAPPTAYQDGMVGPHWSKGWIIEDCEISDSKCSGISLGKYLQPTNDNKWLHEKFKDGTQTQRDCVLLATYEGWDKEHIGSHIVRRNHIHDCGQTGIVGHLGGAFSIIEDNHIHHICTRQNLAGAEIGGIKMHAAIDCIFRRNHIHHCTRGMWLDWEAQGTRVTENLFHDNTLPYDHLFIDEDHASSAAGEDLFVEISHGPTLVDNNFLLSDRSLKLPTQGVALVHNLIAGSITAIGRGVKNGSVHLDSSRYTPYHERHGTQVRGFMTILHGDTRAYNNIFIQQKIRPGMLKMMEKCGSDQWDTFNVYTGMSAYDGFQTEEEWKKNFDGYCGMGSPASDRYYIPLPVWTGGNVYLNGAKPWEKEQNYAADTTEKVGFSLREEDGKWYLDTDLFDAAKRVQPEEEIISSDVLGKAFEPEQRFENPDGTSIVWNSDYYGEPREMHPSAGPVEHFDPEKPLFDDSTYNRL